jgi:hypothetical protein
MELNKENILNLYPEYDSVLGPYKRKDGRQHIVLNNSKKAKKEKGKLKTISYPKAIYESNNGLISDNETIDHKDKNFYNNNKENLDVLDRSKHTELDVKRNIPVYKNCFNCGKIMELTINQLRLDKSEVFCSKHCSGVYGKQIQLDLIEKQKKYIDKPDKYSNKEIHELVFEANCLM